MEVKREELVGGGGGDGGILETVGMLFEMVGCNWLSGIIGHQLHISKIIYFKVYKLKLF